MKQVLNRFRRFCREQHGTATVEMVLVLPLLIWTHLATYEYFDAFGTITRNMRATYTLADMISRQTGTVTPTYVQGMESIYAFLNNNPPNAWVRVTAVSWDPNAGQNGQYFVMWSQATDTANTKLDDISIQGYTSKLPNITSSDTLIMVETRMTYVPAFSIGGVAQQTFMQTVVTQPRLSAQVAFNAS
jgi:Flp pilus assembly protein TadG